MFTYKINIVFEFNCVKVSNLFIPAVQQVMSQLVQQLSPEGP